MHVQISETYSIRTKYTRVLNYVNREEMRVPRNTVHECLRGRVSELGSVKL